MKTFSTTNLNNRHWIVVLVYFIALILEIELFVVIQY